ncbi:MAG: hypothetical protein IPP98_06805 [Gemmatimonadetes bacterium]|nr:hypothetical protein [Gemmatimonadota bacterium]
MLEPSDGGFHLAEIRQQDGAAPFELGIQRGHASRQPGGAAVQRVKTLLSISPLPVLRNRSSKRSIRAPALSERLTLPAALIVRPVY